MHTKPADLFAALSNPTRLRIVNLLCSDAPGSSLKEVCVCDLCVVLDLPQPKVSRHLSVLRAAQLVEVRTDGKWKFYQLAAPRSALHRSLLRGLREGLEDFEELAADRESLAGLELRLRCT